MRIVVPPPKVARTRAWYFGGCSLAFLLAYWRLLVGEFAVPSLDSAEQVLFETNAVSPILVIALAAWLLWARRGGLVASGTVPRANLAIALALVALAVHTWARVSAAEDLLLVSLAASLLAFGSLAGGRPGLRATMLPATVLLLGMDIPAPTQQELLWTLQLWTAKSAEVLAGVLGLEFVSQGTLLTHADRHFLVIEECSGLQGIRTLFIAALVIRQLFASGSSSSWWLVAAAPVLGFVLNVVRVTLIAFSSDPEALSTPGSHLAQGMGTLLIGVALLLAGARLLGFEHGPELDGTPGAVPTSSLLPSAGTYLCLLAALTWLVPTLPPTHPPRSALAGTLSDWPIRVKAWRGERQTPDWIFIGQLSLRHVASVQYKLYGKRKRAPVEAVNLFVGVESGLPGAYPFSSKLLPPGRGWNLIERRPDRIPSLFQDVTSSVFEQEGQRVLSFVWFLRDDGIWAESLRSLLGLDGGPFRRERERIVVRLATRMQPGEIGHQEASRALKQFAQEFYPHLSSL